MTQPSNGDRPARPATPPPSPKVQALSTALELAKIRAAAGRPNNRETTVEQLIGDAEKIASFIGTAQSVGRIPPLTVP